MTTSARWYLCPEQQSERLFQVVGAATGGVWMGRPVVPVGVSGLVLVFDLCFICDMRAGCESAAVI